MKHIFFIILTFIIFYSCNPFKRVDLSVKNSGKTIVENGKGILDTIDYTCINCEKYLNKISFDSIVKQSTKKVNSLMNIKRSFIPLKMEIVITKQDSLFNYDTNAKIENTYLIVNRYYFVAQNAFGTEVDGDTYISFYTDSIGGEKDIENIIKLKPLKLNEDGTVNRNLSLYDGEDKIYVMPYKKSIIVNTNISCVSSGAWLTFNFENGEKFHILSWNDFNCKSTSFFNWFTDDQIYLLKNNKVKYLTFTDDKSVSCSIPENEQDYFIQLIDLYTNK